MVEAWRYRGQEIGREQIAFLREFIREHPTSSRWKLSRQICEALGWKQANGALRDMVCRGLLLMLERAGQIELPPVRRHIRGQCRTERPRPDALLIDTSPVEIPLKELGPVEIQPVRRTADRERPKIAGKNTAALQSRLWWGYGQSSVCVKRRLSCLSQLHGRMFELYVNC